MSHKNQSISKFSAEDLPLDTHEASLLLGYKSSTLRISRVTGILGGVAAPAYRKLGRKVVYDRATLNEWLSQFQMQSNTGYTNSGQSKPK